MAIRSRYDPEVEGALRLRGRPRQQRRGDLWGPSPPTPYDEEAWIKTVDVNLNGTFPGVQGCLPLMTAAASM